MKQFIALSLIYSQIFAGFGYARAGGLNGGGVDVVINPRHDQVVLADPFGIPVSGLPSSYKELFSKEIQLEVDKLIRFSTEILGGKLAKTLRDLITSGDIEFYVVKELPKLPECMRVVQYEGLQADEAVARAACTVGKSTWIIDELFRRLSTGEQALALAHEGFRRLSPVAGDAGIFRIVTGMAVALKHINLQESGDYQTLDTMERVRIKDFVRMSWKMTEFSGYTPKEGQAVEDYISKLEVWPRGGGIVHRGQEENIHNRIDPSVTLGMGMMVLAHSSRIGAGSKLNHTDVCQLASCVIGKDAHIMNVMLQAARGEVEMGDDVAILDTNLPKVTKLGSAVALIHFVAEDATSLQVGTGSRLINSTIRGGSVEVGADTLVKNSKLINESYREYLTRLGNRVSIQNFDMTFDYQEPSHNPIFFAAAIVAILGTGAMIGLAYKMNKNMHFLDGFSADLHGEKLCPEGQKPITHHPSNVNYEFKDLEELKGYCKKNRR